MLRRLRLLFLLVMLVPLAHASERFVDPPWSFSPPPQLDGIRAYILVDPLTRVVIAQYHAHRRLPPASLTKLMTAYLTYGALRQGQLHWRQDVPVSVAAWQTGGSRMFIQPGRAVDVDQLLHGLIIDSGNDAAVALAQAVAGSRHAFIRLMNETARRLGLRGTHYSDVDGLPAPHLHTTAYDVALLSVDLLERDPGILRISAMKSYRYNGITQASWNPLLFHDPWVDGLKTGHTQAAGYCMDETAWHDGRRLLAVVMGGTSWQTAMRAADTLLHYGYRVTRTITLVPGGTTIGYDHLRDLSPSNVPFALPHSLRDTVPTDFTRTALTLVFDATKTKTRSAIKPGESVGTLRVLYHGQTIATATAIARRAAVPAEWWQLLWRQLRRLF